MSAAPTAGSTDTAELILARAERLIQTRGFNGFSYGDIASDLGVSTPALHYHYRSKALLGEAVVARYTERFFAALDGLSADGGGATRLIEEYVDLYRQVLLDGRLCLCGILAAEYATLPEGVRAAVRDFFSRNENWLSAVLDADPAAVDGEALDTARLIIDTLEGAMMIARAQDDPRRFDRVVDRMLSAVL